MQVFAHDSTPRLNAHGQPLDLTDFDYSGTHLGERKITATLQSHAPVSFSIGDYILYDTAFDNERLYLQTTPVVSRVYNSPMLSYTLTFWWVGYELQLVNFLDAVTGEPSQVYYSNNASVSFEGNIEELTRRIKYNMDRAGYTGWTIVIDPAADTTQVRTIVAENQKCWEVLQLLKSEFNTEYSFLADTRTILVGAQPVVAEYESGPFVFEYGYEKGLCEISRLQNDQPVVNRVYAYGSDRNIRPDYRSNPVTHEYHPRLILPHVGQVGYTYFRAEDGWLQIDPLVAEYGVREGYYTNDLIYPTLGEDALIEAVDPIADQPLEPTIRYEKVLVRDGYYEMVVNPDWVHPDPDNPDPDPLVPRYIQVYHEPVYKTEKIIDPAPNANLTTFTVYVPNLGFDINDEHVKTTQAARMSFLTGHLQGMEFTIASWEKNMVMTSGVLSWDNTYKVTLHRNADDPNHILPSSTVCPVAGDRFTLLNIFLPASYETSAEQRLLDDAIAWLESNAASPEGYSIKIPEEFVARHPGIEYYLKESNAVMFRDVLLGIAERAVLIQSITISYKHDRLLPTYDLQISDSPIRGYVQRIEAQLKDARRQIAVNRYEQVINDQRTLKSATINYNRITTSSGDINGAIISPQSIQPSALSSDLRATNYLLQAYFAVNYLGDENSAYGSSGTLTHTDGDLVWGDIYDLDHRTWTIAAPQTFTLDASAYYFVYIKCNVTDGSALWVLSPTRFHCEQVDGYYMFFWGCVLPVRDGRRYTQGEHGENPISSYVYIAYASDNTGASFTLTPNEALAYMAILSSPSEIPEPTVELFAGLWWKRKAASGLPATITSSTTNSDNGVTHTHELNFSVNTQDITAGFSVKYGALYNFYAVADSRNIANVGFRVPTHTDITALETDLGGYSLAGGKLKETGTEHWLTPNTGATNEYGMSVRGGGYRSSYDGLFYALKENVYLHTQTEQSADRSWYVNLEYNSASSEIWHDTKKDGLSAILINDSPTISDGQTGTYTGNDGKVYKTVCINGVEYLAEPLAETKYRNGDLIPVVTDGAEWGTLTTGGMCYYDNDPENGGVETTLADELAGLKDHGALEGLDQDDHPQYHNDARGDARYVQKGYTEDISFEFADITAGTAQTYTLDIKASFGYTIESACLETNNGTLTGVAVKINSTAVTSLSSLTVDTAVDETSSTGAKTVVAGDRVYISTSTGYTGEPTLLRGKLKIVRT